MSLPSTIALKSIGEYKGYYIKVVDDYLEYAGGLLSPTAKFAIDSAKLGGGLVHIRCCYTNKYWVRSSSTGLYIFVTATEPVEDTTAWNCTLFRPILLNNNSEVRFVHVQSGVEVRREWGGPKHLKRLTINPQHPNIDQLGVVDYETVAILPKVVAFKGHNGKFLRAYYQKNNNKNHLQFGHDEIGSELVPQEVFHEYESDLIGIYSTYFKKYWELDENNYIVVDARDYHYRDTLFQPVKISKNVIALRRYLDTKYLTRFTWDKDYLGARGEMISNESYLEVYEPIVARSVKSVVFHKDRARVYGHQLLDIASVEDRNTTNTVQQSSVSLKYTIKTTRTWNNSINVTAGYKTTVEADIPFVGKFGIEFSVQSSFTTEWGKTEEEEKTIDATYNVTVPPKTLAKITVYATKACCDVPFSYVQTDTLVDGRILTQTLSDGVFSGVNSYNFYNERVEEPLP